MENRLTVSREERGEGQQGIIEERPSKNMCEGHTDKAKGGRFEAERWGWVG